MLLNSKDNTPASLEHPRQACKVLHQKNKCRHGLFEPRIAQVLKPQQQWRHQLQQSHNILLSRNHVKRPHTFQSHLHSIQEPLHQAPVHICRGAVLMQPTVLV